MNLILEKRTAVIAGASRGIGLAIARSLYDAGANVVLSSRSESNLEAAAKSFNDVDGRVHVVTAHVG